MTNTPAYRQQWILEEFKKSPLISYVDMWAKYKQKWEKGKTTFDKDWKQAKEQHQAYQRKANEEKEKVSIQMEIEAVKNGLKTKFDRLMILQNQVDDLLGRLERGVHLQETFKDGKVLKFERTLTPHEIAMYNRTIKDLQSEISRIENDYAPTRTEVDIRQITGMIIK